MLGAYLRGRQDGLGRRGLGVWLRSALAVAAAAVRVNPVDDRRSASGSAGSAAAYRMDIWRATLPVVKDFWLTGTGAGTFETVMLVYQRAPSLFRINAAHNHYLQVAAEGGLLIGIPVAVALVLFVREARDGAGARRVRACTSSARAR